MLLVSQTGCWRASSTSNGAKTEISAAKSAISSKQYTLTGVVRKVDAKAGEVTIRHEAVPGFMPAMSMPFTIKDRSKLSELAPGDKVEGTLRVTERDGAVVDYELSDLNVTTPAPRTLVLDVSKGKVALSERPEKLEIGESVPDFTMTTQDGKTTKLSDLRGNVVVMTFIYTRCPMPDFCPLMDRKFAELAQKASTFPERAERIRLISLSFDPENDRPEVLRKHAQIRGASPPLWTYAVAPHDELAKIAAPLGLLYERGTREIAHNLVTAVIDQRGKLTRLDVGTKSNQWDSSDMLKTIYAQLGVARP